jgi:serine/threonine-protein kinase HipA
LSLYRPRVLSTAIDWVDASASIDLAMNVADYFEVGSINAKKIINEVGTATALWRQEAANHKIKKAEIDLMASAFEHVDLQKALHL